MSETTLHIETIYSGKIVHLEVHTIELDGGLIGKREIIQHPGAVAVVALDQEQRVLLVRQFRSAARLVMLEIPAGLLEKDENPLDCAIRELREETGYRPLQIEALGGFYVAAGYTTEYIHLFLTTAFETDPLPQDTEERIEVVPLPLTEALALIERGEISDSKTIIALLRVARRLGI